MSKEKGPQDGLEKLQSILEWLSDSQKDEMFKLLVKDKEKRWELKEELVWFEEGVLNDLKKNHIKIEENAEMMWYKWRKIHIDLPAAWDFKWFKFDCFVSDNDIYNETFEEDPKLIDRSYTTEDISDLVKAFNRYMHAYWLDMRGKYADDFKKTFWYTGCCLKELAWFHEWYHLKDVDEKTHYRVQRNCDYGHGCYFDRYFGGEGYLLLKPSD